MNESSVAIRYAKALLILTEKQTAKAGSLLVPVLEVTRGDLESFAALVAPGTRLGELLAHPKVSPLDKRKVLGLALEGRVVNSVLVFADLLLRKKRLALATPISHEFKALVDIAKGVQMATVVSAVPLNEAERTRLLTELQTVTGKHIVLAAELDPSLIGGAYVRIGDRVIDRSVKTLLEAVSHQLYEVSV